MMRLRLLVVAGAAVRVEGFALRGHGTGARGHATGALRGDPGGTVEPLYEDPTGAHGGLAKNADAWGAMFSYFEGLR